MKRASGVDIIRETTHGITSDIQLVSNVRGDQLKTSLDFSTVEDDSLESVWHGLGNNNNNNSNDDDQQKWIPIEGPMNMSIRGGNEVCFDLTNIPDDTVISKEEYDDLENRMRPYISSKPGTSIAWHSIGKSAPWKLELLYTLGYSFLKQDIFEIAASSNLPGLAWACSRLSSSKSDIWCPVYTREYNHYGTDSMTKLNKNVEAIVNFVYTHLLSSTTTTSPPPPLLFPSGEFLCSCSV